MRLSVSAFCCWAGSTSRRFARSESKLHVRSSMRSERCCCRKRLSFFEKATLRHLGCLILARIDGKSPVEYLPEESIQNQVRVIAKDLILRCPETLEECLERTFGRHDSTPLRPQIVRTT